MIIENIKTIQQRIDAACKRAGRSPEEITLLPVTKTVPIERIRTLLQTDLRAVGENKVQEALSKYQEIPQLQWHMIGHLQTNKVKDVVKFASMVQSVDRYSLAEKLDRQLQKEGRSLDILIQVNTSAEEQKSGVTPEETLSLIESFSVFHSLKIRGLMTIALHVENVSESSERIRKCFKLMKELSNQCRGLNQDNVNMEILSMGMSADLDIAVEEGSTMLRIGSAIFGDRIYI